MNTARHPTNGALSTRIRHTIEEHPDLDATAIRVTASSGFVQLHGAVHTHSERLLLLNLVSAVTGVLGLDNKVQVEPAGPNWELDDHAVCVAAETAARDAGILPGEVTMAVTQHVLTLSGTVASVEQRNLLRHTVAEVPGVDFVRNNLDIAAHGTESLELPETEIWRLLEQENIGRLAVRLDDGVDIFPVNYLIASEVLYFRSGPGAKMIELTADPRVAFEVDGGRGRERWSVVIRGIARRLNLDTEIASSGVAGLKPWDQRDKFNYVAIQPETLSGRRFRRH